MQLDITNPYIQLVSIPSRNYNGSSINRTGVKGELAVIQAYVTSDEFA